jgi:hypothetical protein
VTGTDAFIRIFLSHGDGTFFIGTLDELGAHSHTYAFDADGYYAFAEVIAAYDDNDKPPKRTALTQITNLNSSVTTPPAGFSLNGKKYCCSVQPMPFRGIPSRISSRMKQMPNALESVVL